MSREESRKKPGVRRLSEVASKSTHAGGKSPESAGSPAEKEKKEGESPFPKLKAAPKAKKMPKGGWELNIPAIRQAVIDAIKSGASIANKGIVEYEHPTSKNKYHIIKTKYGWLPLEYPFGRTSEPYRPTKVKPEEDAQLRSARTALGNYDRGIGDKHIKVTLEEVANFAKGVKIEPLPEPTPEEKAVAGPRPTPQPTPEPPKVALTEKEKEEIEEAATDLSADEIKQAQAVQQLLMDAGIERSLGKVIEIERARAAMAPPEVPPENKYRAHMKWGRINEYSKLKYLMEKEKQNFLLPGPTGSGKTLMVKTYCAENDLPLLIVPCTRDLDLIGSRELVEREGLTTSVTEYVLGPLAEAMENGYVLLLDEINALDPYMQVKLTTALEERRCSLPQAVGGKKEIIADPRFRCIGAYNPGFKGTFKLNRAIYNRFTGGVIRFDYLEAPKEVQRFKEIIRGKKDPKTGQWIIPPLNENIPITNTFETALQNSIVGLRQLGESKERPYATSRGITNLAYTLDVWWEKMYHSTDEIGKALGPPTTEELKEMFIDSLASPELPKEYDLVNKAIASEFQGVKKFFGGTLIPQKKEFTSVLNTVMAEARAQGSAKVDFGNLAPRIKDEIAKKYGDDLAPNWENEIFDKEGKLKEGPQKYVDSIMASLVKSTPGLKVVVEEEGKEKKVIE